MIAVQIGSGFWLDGPAAASYLRMRRAGCPPGITTAGRTYAQQAQMYEAYLAGRLPAFAAKPGTSKHERGNAIDVPEPARSWIRAYGGGFGWLKDRVNSEPWHMEYQAGFDRHENDSQEADMDATQNATLNSTQATLQNVEKNLFKGGETGGGMHGDILEVRKDVRDLAAVVRALAARLPA